MQIISQDCHIQINPDHLSHSKVRIRVVINGMTGKTVVLSKYSNNSIHIIISKDCHIKVNLNHLSHSKVRSRGVINGKTDKVRQLSYPNIQICSSLHIIISQDCHIQVNHDHLNHSKVGSRVINGKTGKTTVLPKHSEFYTYYNFPRLSYGAVHKLRKHIGVHSWSE